jgi:excinuclease UvrABC ATPase subunit
VGHRTNNSIQIRGAREHNLKNINVSIPRDKFTVITGISGSGKSTLAFDILSAEGQRRYLESLNAYARQFVQPSSRPDVDAVFGIPPTVAIEQSTSRGGRKSTIATVTEVYRFLRLLFVKLGTQYCPDCNVPIQPQTPASILNRISTGQRVELLAPLIVARKGLYNDLAEWARKNGFLNLRVDGKLVPAGNWPRETSRLANLDRDRIIAWWQWLGRRDAFHCNRVRHVKTILLRVVHRHFVTGFQIGERQFPLVGADDLGIGRDHEGHVRLLAFDVERARRHVA